MGILDRAIKQQQETQKQGFQATDPKELGSLFERLGVSPDRAADYAELYGNLSQGGKTAFANMFIDRFQRGEFGKMDTADLEGMEGIKGPLSDVTPEEEGFEFPKLDTFAELTPKEKIKKKGDLSKQNYAHVAEVAKRMEGFEDETRDYQTLMELNESGKLPTGLEKFNVDWNTGDLRYPALANAETQAFVKTINNYVMKIKDVFGTRITNFEIQTFMKRLPTLANSPEGRRMILDQMKDLTDLRKMHAESISEVYKKYGQDGIDRQKVEEIARDLTKYKGAALAKRINESELKQNVLEAQADVPEGRVVVINPDGKTVQYVAEKNVDKAKQRGYRIP